MVGGTIRRKVIHRESFRASVLHPSEIQAVLQSIAEKKCLLTTPSLLAESWPQLVTVSMVGGTIRRKVIHRESFRASVLHPSEIQAVLQSIAEKKCLLTRPSLLSRGTRGSSRRSMCAPPARQERRVDWIRAKAPFGGRVCFWLEDRSKFGRKEPSMMLIGCDYHPSWQQISWLDTATGETGEKKLEHASGEAEKFYRGLPGPALIGMESTGNCQWFVEMATTAGHDVWIGDAAKIRASDVRQQKHDRRDAALILKLLL